MTASEPTDVPNADEDSAKADADAMASPPAAGRGPTADEAAAAESAAQDAPDVEDEYRDMTEKGANVKGEGEIE